MYVINVLGKLFCTTNHESVGKRKPFKINNSSEVLYGWHISNAPTTGRERCDEHFREKLHSNSCHVQLCWIQSCL